MTLLATSRSRWLTALLVSFACAVAALAGAVTSPASAAVKWNAEVDQVPTNLPPGGRGGVRIIVQNAGSSESTANPTVTFTLPEGVTLGDPTPSPVFGWACSGAGTPQVVTCNTTVDSAGYPSTVVKPWSYVGSASTGRPSLFIRLVLETALTAPEGVFPFPVTMAGGGHSVTQIHELRVNSDQPGFGVIPGSFKAGPVDETGAPDTRAGGHPYELRTGFKLNTKFTEPQTVPFNAPIPVFAVGSLRDVIADLPPGLVGNPTNVPRCPTLEQVMNDTCPISAQVGVASLSPPEAAQGGMRIEPIFNVMPGKNEPALLAFDSVVGTILLRPVIRTDGNMGLSIHLRNVTQADPSLTAAAVTIWGTPAGVSHNALRCIDPNFIANACTGTSELGGPSSDVTGLPNPSTAPLKPFISNPTECDGQPLSTFIHIDQWANPGSFEADGDPNLGDPAWTSEQAQSPPMEGCESLPFEPAIDVQPTVATPDSPTGLDLELTVPQNDDVDGRATAHLRDATITLPEGMTINPSSVDGLDVCGPEQIGLVSKEPLAFSKDEPTCPFASKIGTMQIDTPLLDDPLAGSVYLARQADNPFDSLLALYMVVRGPGVLVKLAAHVKADPQTGRLSTTVIDNPQLPFESLEVHLKSGPRAPLTTPSTCGTHEASAALTSWAGHAKAVSDAFSIDCPSPFGTFDPDFTAGSTGVAAGVFSPFTARITRQRGKELGRIGMTLPKGMLANLRPVTVCSDEQIAAAAGKAGRVTQAAPACPAGSQVGTTTVGTGSGPLFYPKLPGTGVSGRVFLTEAHTGTTASVPGALQPDYGLAIEVPAVAGPFDLGTVLVRAAMFIDPETAQVTVISDKLPRTLQVVSGPQNGKRTDGIPLDARDVRVDIDRRSFATTPTSCAETKVAADIEAQDGTSAARSVRYQVGDCAALDLEPRVSMRLTGRGQTRTEDNPGLRVRVRQPGSKVTNLREVRAVLPRALALDGSNAAGDWLCDYEQGQRGQCPRRSRIGTAKAWSPLLKRPVSGPVYFVKGIRFDQAGNPHRTLPTLLLALDGEARIYIRAKSSVDKASRLVSTFTNLPDARVSRVDMSIRGGAKRGVLAVTGANTNLCDGRRRAAQLRFRGQNGDLARRSVRLSTPCKGKKSGGRSRRKR